MFSFLLFKKFYVPNLFFRSVPNSYNDYNSFFKKNKNMTYSLYLIILRIFLKAPTCILPLQLVKLTEVSYNHSLFPIVVKNVSIALYIIVSSPLVRLFAIHMNVAHISTEGHTLKLKILLNLSSFIEQEPSAKS